MTPVPAERALWDISPALDATSAVFPGDTPYSQRLHFEQDASCPVNVHALTLSPHAGAHADAPLHYAAGARASGALPLAPYLGRCRVIHAHGFDSPTGCPALITTDLIAHALADLPARVLIRTSRVASQSWEHFSALCPALVAFFAMKSVVLIGIDTPSIDPAASQDLPCHALLHQHDMRVLENLVLNDVPPGDYELIALPLKLMQSDASPVRAVLRSLD